MYYLFHNKKEVNCLIILAAITNMIQYQFFLILFTQTLLNFHGFSLECDSSFGPATQKAVVDFQRSRDIEADGVAGPTTWRELMKIAKNT